MGRGSPVCQQIREKIIEMFKNNVPQRKMGRDLDISPSSAVDFSGLGGIWDGPSHSGYVDCGQMNQYFRYFLGGMDAMCSGPKKKRIIQTVTSNKSKSQGLSWYGVVSVPLAKVTCTSVMAPLMLKST